MAVVSAWIFLPIYFLLLVAVTISLGKLNSVRGDLARCERQVVQELQELRKRADVLGKDIASLGGVPDNPPTDAEIAFCVSRLREIENDITKVTQIIP